MAYMRGEPYVWSDGDFLHIWSHSGDDGWKEVESYAGLPDASGVQFAEQHADEFAVMRFAELVATGRFHQAMERAMERWGENDGAAALRKLGRALGVACDAIPHELVRGAGSTSTV